MPFKQGDAVSLKGKVTTVTNLHLDPSMHVVVVTLNDGQQVQTSMRNLKGQDTEGKAVQGPPENKALSNADRERMSQPASRQSPAPQPDTVSSGQAPGLRDQSQSGDPNTAVGPQYGKSPANKEAQKAGQDPFGEDTEPDAKRKTTPKNK